MVSNHCKCGEGRARASRYCSGCKNRYMREWRKTHRQSEEERRKNNARAYLHVYLRRKKVIRGRCEVCGSGVVQAHHDDYSKPLEARWFCKEHHRMFHKEQFQQPTKGSLLT